MKSIPIPGYKGLKIVNCAGTATMKLHNKDVLGHSKGAQQSLGIKVAEFELTDDIKSKVIAWHDSQRQTAWTKYLSAEDFAKMNDLQALYDRRMARFKATARMSAFAELDKTFA